MQKKWSINLNTCNLKHDYIQKGGRVYRNRHNKTRKEKKVNTRVKRKDTGHGRIRHTTRIKE